MPINPDNTRKIICQCNCFEKTIVSEHLEKENMVFRAMYLYYRSIIRQNIFFLPPEITATTLMN